MQERGAYEQGPGLTLAGAFLVGFEEKDSLLPEQRKGKNEDVERTKKRIQNIKMEVWSFSQYFR